MKAQLCIALLTIINIVSYFVSSAHAQNTGEILIIPENAEEIISSDGIRFLKDGKVTFPSGTTTKVNFDLDSSNDSTQESDDDQDK